MTENRQELNRNLAQMLKGGVIMDVTTPEQARMQRLPVHVQLWLWSVFLPISVLQVVFLV